MGLPKSTLIEIANEIITPHLEDIGYLIDTDPSLDEKGWMFDYVQSSGEIDDMHRILGFQPNGFGTHDFFDIAINLTRSRNRSGIGTGDKADPREIYNIRLAPCLWQKGGAMDYWWHFVTEDELKIAYEDILNRILEFGIPFLNDPESSFELWYERGTGKKLK